MVKKFEKDMRRSLLKNIDNSCNIYDDDNIIEYCNDYGGITKCSEDVDGSKHYFEYDKQNRIRTILHKYPDGDDTLYQYDEQGHVIHFKCLGYEQWFEYDSRGNLIHYHDLDGCEIWYEYQMFDDSLHLIHQKDMNGFEQFWSYDKQGNLTHYKNTNGYEQWITYDETNKLYYKDSNDIEYEISCNMTIPRKVKTNE